ncbi:MAG: MFS transporter, partial [Alphaproteobacteria bacterium]|nr:MFS transporter [Alphaproteobacteria bacterium]
AGNAVAAIIAQATAAPSTDGENVVLAVYKNVGWIAVAVGVGMAALSPFLAKLMHLDTLNDNPEEQVADAFGDGQKPAT